MQSLKTTLFAILALLVLSASAACAASTPVPTATPAPTLQPIDAQRDLSVDGLERTYLIHVPPAITGADAVPMLFVFHGFQEDSTYARSYTGFNDIADANGFIVAYAEGSGASSGLSWNGGTCCGYALVNDVDETAFVNAILADVETLAVIDRNRVFAAGFSNGALLSYRLACEMSETFAAVAPVGGVLVYEPCEPSEPVSVMHVHGMTDGAVPFEGGGLNPGTGEPFPPVQESIAAWVKLDACLETAQTEQDEIMTHSMYGGCASGSAVELYALEGTGHTWPSRYVVPISETIWEFFSAHPKQ
jgi:polyhydroxybutyrate depolymerase